MDVACLELADYAKKVSCSRSTLAQRRIHYQKCVLIQVKELTKELKETKAALELSDREKDGLAEVIIIEFQNSKP